MKAVMASFKAQLDRKSVSTVAWLEGGMPKIILGWVACIVVAGILRTSFVASPITNGASLFQTILPYILLGLSPLAAYWIADQLFPRGLLMQQPEIRLSRIGKWRSVDVLAARSNPLFGPTGLMASLLVGLLLNVAVRSLEFLAAVPAMNGNAPLWGQVLFAVTTFDVVVMNFLYVLCFMAALRCAPWFPRFLFVVWGFDITAQLFMAHIVMGTEGLPVGVGDALGNLLQGNLQKVMISIAIWAPYLILSERVNLTYRSRVALQPA